MGEAVCSRASLQKPKREPVHGSGRVQRFFFSPKITVKLGSFAIVEWRSQLHVRVVLLCRDKQAHACLRFVFCFLVCCHVVPFCLFRVGVLVMLIGSVCCHVVWLPFCVLCFVF